MKVYLLCLCILAAGSVSATDIEKRYLVSSEYTKIVEKYQESGIWAIDVYKVLPGALQDRVQTFRSKSRSEIEKTWDRNFARWSSQKPLQFNMAQEIVPHFTSPLWEVTESWNASWERRYALWVQQEFDKEFFARYGIATDCADAAVALRWIFSRINGLPAANHLAGSGALVTQDTVRRRWLSLPTGEKWYEDQRFLKVIDYLADNTYTHTLFRDSYPIAINRDSLVAGVILVELSGHSGHARIISETNYQDRTKLPIVLLSSTVPKSVRSLYEEPFLGISTPIQGRSGLRQQSWPVRGFGGWRLQRPEQGLHYSQEQFSSSHWPDFARFTYRKLEVELNLQVILESALQDLISNINARIRVVEQGYANCQIQDCSPGTVAWENWSTPSRDRRLLGKFNAIQRLKYELPIGSDLEGWIDFEFEKSRWNIDGIDLTLSNLYFSFLYSQASHDPRDSIRSRWGLEIRD